MVEFINIEGNYDEVKYNIEYYAKTSNVGLKGVEELRKEFINQFLQDYIASSKKELKSMEFNDRGVVLDSTSEEKKQEVENVNNEKIQKVNRGIVLDDKNYGVKENSNSAINENDIEYSSVGVLLDDSDNYDYSHDGSSYNGENDNEYDEVVFDFNKPFFSNNNDDMDEGVEYTKRGIVLEDFLSDDDIVGDNDEIDDYSEPFDSVEDEEDDNSKYFDSTEDTLIDVNNTKVDDCSEPSPVEEGKEDDYSNYINFTEEEETSVKSSVNSTVGNTPKVSHQNSKVIQVDSYKNVRDFVKKNPGCTISDVKEYFSVKEIQKALMSSKVVQKKGKLYIV